MYNINSHMSNLNRICDFHFELKFAMILRKVITVLDCIEEEIERYLGKELTGLKRIIIAVVKFDSILNSMPIM